MVLTLTASSYMVVQMGPQIGRVVAPLALIAVMALPSAMFMARLWKKNYNLILVWAMATRAGWLHSLSWTVWLFALAGS